MSATPPVQPIERIQPVQWRVELVKPAMDAPHRGRLRKWGVPTILLMILLAIAGSTAGLISTLRPLPKPRLVAICMNPPLDLRALHAPTVRDIQALADSGVFSKASLSEPAKAPQGLTQAGYDQQLAQLDSLQGDEPVIVYVSAFATVDAAQQVMLLAGSTLDRTRESQRPLAELLSAVQRCRATRKLLILELGWPNAGVEVMSKLQEQYRQLASTNYSILCTCSPGETARTIYEPRRSLFGYFLEQGLLGHADGFLDHRSDGRVSTDELVGYVKQAVDSYSIHLYATHQTPVVLGTLASFDLCASSAAGLAKSDIAQSHRTQSVSDSPVATQPAKYPVWLQAAWQARDRMIETKVYQVALPRLVQLENEIFAAESAWRDGQPEEALQVSLESSVQALDAWAADKLAYFRGPVTKLQTSMSNDRAGFASFVSNEKSPPREKKAPDENKASDEKKASSASIANEQAANESKASENNQANGADRSRASAATTGDESSSSDAAVSTASTTELQASVAQFIQQAMGLSAVTPSSVAGTSAAGTPAAGTSAAGTPVAVAALVDEFQKAHAAVSPEVLTQTLYDYVSEHPHFLPPQLAYIHLLLPNSGGGPLGLHGQVLESLVRDQLRGTKQPLNRESMQGLLKLISLNEQRTAHPQILPWLADLQATCDLNRVEIERGLWGAHGGSQPLSNQLQAAINEQQQLTTIRRRLESAYDAVAYSRLQLQQSLPLDGPHYQLHQWCNAADKSEQLGHIILQPGAAQASTAMQRLTASQQIHYLHAETIQLRSQMNQLIDYASPQQISNLVEASESQGADMGHLLELQRLLATSLPTAEQRQSLHTTAYRLAPKVHQRILQQMQLSPTYAAAASHRVDKVSPSAAQSKQASQIADAFELQTQLAAEQLPLEDWEQHLSAAWNASEQLYFALAQSNPRIDYYASTAQLYRIEGKRHRFPIATSAAKSNVYARLQQVSPAIERGHLIAIKDRVATSPGESRTPPTFGTQSPRQPELVVDWLPAVPAGSAAVESIRLRTLKGHQAYRLRVTNPSAQPQTVTVELHGGTETLTASPIALAPGASAAVTFAGQPPKPEDTLPELLSGLRLRVLEATTQQLLLEQPVLVEIATPREYVEVLSATFTPYSIGRNQLEIWLRATQPLDAGPCVAKLTLDPAKIQGLVSVTSGKLETVLDPTGQPTRLLAEGLEFREDKDNAGTFEISIDGVARAFRFQGHFTRVGQPTTPQLLSRPTLELLAPTTGRTGTELPVRLQVENAPRQATLSLQLDSGSHVTADVDRTYTFPSPQHHRLGFTGATGGELLFSAELNDWLVNMDTSHLVGQRRLSAELATSAGVIAEAEQPLALDDRPPRYLQFEQFPQRAAVGTTHRLLLAAESPLTGIDKVQLFVGNLVDGKIPAGADLIDCRRATWNSNQLAASSGDRSWWEVELTWPQQLGDFYASAKVTNGAGLETVSTIKLTTVTAAELNVGEIRGSILEGGTPQPELDIFLLNPAGATIAKVKSHLDGTFVFSSVAVGEYTLFSNKPSSRRSAQRPVLVRAGEITASDLALRLAR